MFTAQVVSIEETTTNQKIRGQVCEEQSFFLLSPKQE